MYDLNEMAGGQHTTNGECSPRSVQLFYAGQLLWVLCVKAHSTARAAPEAIPAPLAHTPNKSKGIRSSTSTLRQVSCQQQHRQRQRHVWLGQHQDVSLVTLVVRGQTDDVDALLLCKSNHF